MFKNCNYFCILSVTGNFWWFNFINAQKGGRQGTEPGPSPGDPSGISITSSPGCWQDLNSAFLGLGSDKEQELNTRWVWLWFISVPPPVAESSFGSVGYSHNIHTTFTHTIYWVTIKSQLWFCRTWIFALFKYCKNYATNRP